MNKKEKSDSFNDFLVSHGYTPVPDSFFEDLERHLKRLGETRGEGACLALSDFSDLDIDAESFLSALGCGKCTCLDDGETAEEFFENTKGSFHPPVVENEFDKEQISKPKSLINIFD